MHRRSHGLDRSVHVAGTRPSVRCFKRAPKCGFYRRGARLEVLVPPVHDQCDEFTDGTALVCIGCNNDCAGGDCHEVDFIGGEGLVIDASDRVLKRYALALLPRARQCISKRCAITKAIMAGEIIRLGDKTSHGGTVLEGSMTDICHGKPIAYIGHKVQCPKCKGTYPIAEGVMTTSFYGKGVAVAGMKTACGATLIASQFTDIVETGGGGGGGSADVGSQAEAAPPAAAAAAAPAAAGAGNAAAGGSETVPANEKKITAVSWSYGQDETPISGVSRFYVDLNVHVETEHYAPGETVNLTIADSEGRDVLDGVKEIALRATVGADGKGKLLNVFAGKTVINYGDTD